jgi:hypothetical protein
MGRYMQNKVRSFMKQWEYVSLALTCSGGDKGVKVTQFGESKFFSLNSNKKFFKNNHIDHFNQIIGKLGFAGWELVSVTTLHGSEYHMTTESYSTDAQSQEYWFKRIFDESQPKIDRTLMYIFKEQTESKPPKKENFDYYNS